MELVLPSVEHKTSYIEAVKEFQADQDFPQMIERVGDTFSTLEAETFDAYVEKILGQSKGDNLLEGYVPQTTYWLVDGEEFIGTVRIRHRLDEFLQKVGGHIGYDVRPSKRGKGYGSKILELALPKAKEIGISHILVTCDATNVASRKIIEKNGGVLENQVPNPETGVDKLRFWIDSS
ncbi:MAG: GNAT family N-acetyltransferase [Patescibacteria group bacterium]